MSDTTELTCRDDRRRALVRARCWHGIDYVETDTDDQGRPILRVFFLTKFPPDLAQPFELANVRITGGRPPGLRALALDFERPNDEAVDDVAIIRLDAPGGRATYTLRLASAAGDGPLPGFDARYSAARFSFVPDAPAEIDCRQPPGCAPDVGTTPELSYLAKDYASFRQLLLDRLALTLPGWRERHSPDLYLTLVELLAYAGDHLSYYQDAVATEAYLETARRRISVRRHVRLVDYALHEGCNARAWVYLEVEGDPEIAADALTFITRPAGLRGTGPVLLPDALRDTPRERYELFEPIIEALPAAITERDIRRPRMLARRLRDPNERGRLLLYIRAQLGAETRALLELAEGPPEELPRLIAALASELNRVLNQPGLALADADAAAQVAARYGSLNALHGACLCQHNRPAFEDALPTELAQPALLRFYQAHNCIRFYTWQQSECCLPAGATSATLRDAWVDRAAERRALRYLRPGDVLIFEEVLGPRSGQAADADPRHRYAVRLTRADPATDPLCDQPIVEIAWDPADALPFALCLSALGPAPECAMLEDVSVARGNVVLADHGEKLREPDPARLRDSARTILAVPFEPPDDLVPVAEMRALCDGEGRLAESFMLAGRYRPTLARGPLVFAEPPPAPGIPASLALRQDPRLARPQIVLFSPVERAHPRRPPVTRLPGFDGWPPLPLLYERWEPRPDLLASAPDDRHFVVEVDDDQRAHVRFGDDEHGATPTPGARFLAAYRVGGGPAGNIAAEQIDGLVLRGMLRGGAIIRVRNPLPAVGGSAPEPLADARLRAPHAFRQTLMRAITADDYAAIVERDFGTQIQRAHATIEPGGGGRAAVRVLLDTRGGADDAEIAGRVSGHLAHFRRLGHDLTVEVAKPVGISLALRVRMLPHSERGAVYAALNDLFSNRALPGGRRGFFHPDTLTFGQGIAISALVARAQKVPGVAAVSVTQLHRQGEAQSLPDDGLLAVGQNEIVRLDNDPDAPANGVLTLILEASR